MTNSHDQELSAVLASYDDTPMQDGDAVFLVDNAVCMEVAGLANDWDDELSVKTAQILQESASAVTLAIARPQARLRDSDYQVWRDLHVALRGTDIALGPVRALPAA